jgi:hypothetical protein
MPFFRIDPAAFDELASEIDPADLPPDFEEQRRSDDFQELNDDLLAKYALDDLAHSLASRLLGNGFGTGEYELCGAFTANLRPGVDPHREGLAGAT